MLWHPPPLLYSIKRGSHSLPNIPHSLPNIYMLATRFPDPFVNILNNMHMVLESTIDLCIVEHS